LYKINDNIDPFDGYLKKISQEEHFSFTESTWSNMEKRLNNNPKKINLKSVGIISLSLAFVISSIFIFTNTNDFNEQSLAHTISNKTLNDNLENSNKNSSLSGKNENIEDVNKNYNATVFNKEATPNNSVDHSKNNLVKKDFASAINDKHITNASSTNKKVSTITNLKNAKNKSLETNKNAKSIANKSLELNENLKSVDHKLANLNEHTKNTENKMDIASSYFSSSHLDNNLTENPILNISESIFDYLHKDISENSNNNNSNLSSLDFSAIDSSFNIFNPNWYQEQPNNFVETKIVSKSTVTKKVNKQYYITEIGTHNILNNTENPYNLGINLGVKYAYLVNEKFEFTFGLSYFKDMLTNDGNSFNQKGNLWEGNAELNILKMKLNILDLPIMVNYIYQTNYNQYKIVTGLGINNSVFLTENYQFSFFDANPTLPSNGQLLFSKFAPLSSVILQFGVDKRLKDKTILGVYPFVFIPLDPLNIMFDKYYKAGVKIVWKFGESDKRFNL
jgi:hypothetical protein